MRRIGDIVIACALLAISLPLMIMVALAIKWDSAGPVFDRHTCIGHGGRRFHILEFRTSVHDLHGTRARETTPIGRFLRRTRINGLPQLMNVLRGEMSLIDRNARSPSFLD